MRSSPDSNFHTQGRIPPQPWRYRLAALAGFLGLAVIVSLAVSRQLALNRAENYVREQFGLDIPIPVRRITPDFFDGNLRKGASPPPLGFCWRVELDTPAAHVHVILHPLNYQVLSWSAEL